MHVGRKLYLLSDKYKWRSRFASLCKVKRVLESARASQQLSSQVSGWNCKQTSWGFYEKEMLFELWSAIWTILINCLIEWLMTQDWRRFTTMTAKCKCACLTPRFEKALLFGFQLFPWARNFKEECCSNFLDLIILIHWQLLKQGLRQHGCSGCICTRQFPATGALHPSWGGHSITT